MANKIKQTKTKKITDLSDKSKRVSNEKMNLADSFKTKDDYDFAVRGLELFW